MEFEAEIHAELEPEAPLAVEEDVTSPHMPEPPVALVDITCQDEKGNSALMLAAAEDRILLVQHILHMASETGRLEQVLMMRNSDGLAALDMAIRRGAGRSAALIAEAASMERRRKKTRLRRVSTSACVLRRQERYHHEPTSRIKDVEAIARRRKEEMERIEVATEETEKIERIPPIMKQRTVSNDSLSPAEGISPGEKNFAQKAVSSLTEKLTNVLRPKKNRIETLPPLDPRRKNSRNRKKQASLDQPGPSTSTAVEAEDEIETLGKDGFYPSEEKVIAASYRFPSILSRRRRAASEHRPSKS